jgi:hypothetical protein
MKMRALSSQSDLRAFFHKSLLGFQFWTFINVHFHFWPRLSEKFVNPI